MKKLKQLLTLKVMLPVLALSSTVALADEGMWQPNQLPTIAKELTKAGLKLNTNDLT